MALDIFYYGDTADCLFTWDVDWGDGNSSQNLDVSDPPDGDVLLAQHTYTTPGTYSIVTTGTATNRCTATGGTDKFTWLPSQSSSPPPLPTHPSPAFVCVTGPGGSCLQPGAGVPQSDTWAPTPPGWLTSPVVGGCALDVIKVVGLYAGWPVAVLTLLTALGGAVQFEESNGNWLVLLTAAMPFHNCLELTSYLLKHQPLPQSIDPLSAEDSQAVQASTPTLFQAVPAWQLKSLKKLPFLRGFIGYAVAQLGAGAALADTYRTRWSSTTKRSLVCHAQRGGFRCDWYFQINGAGHSGYVLVGVAGDRYRLEKVIQISSA